MRIVLMKGWTEGKKIIMESKSMEKNLLSSLKTKMFTDTQLEKIHPKPPNGVETSIDEDVLKMKSPAKVEQEEVR